MTNFHENLYNGMMKSCMIYDNFCHFYATPGGRFLMDQTPPDTPKIVDFSPGRGGGGVSKH